MIFKYYTEYASTATPQGTLIDSDTKRRWVHYGAASNDVYLRSNFSDSVGSGVFDVINDSWSAFDAKTIGYSMKNTGTPYIAGFYNGVADGTNEVTDNYTTNAWGTYFYVGCDSGSANQLSGIIQEVAFYGTDISIAQHLQGYERKKIRIAA